MSLNQLYQNKYKPYLDTRVNNSIVDGVISLNEKDGSKLVEPNFGDVYKKADNKLYYKDDVQVEHLITGGAGGGPWLALDSNLYPNQKRSGLEANNSIGINSDLTSVSTTETGPAELGLVIGSETATKLAQFMAVKHQDANEQPIYALVRTRGNEATPTAVQGDDNIGGIYGISYNDNNAYEVNGILQFEAVSNQTATNADGRMVVRLTPTNAVVPDDVFVIDQDATIALKETATPALLAGFGKIYVKSSDNGLYFLDSNGVEWPLGGAAVVDTLQETYDASNPANITLNGTNGGIVIDPNGESEPIQITGWLEMNNSGADKKLVLGYQNTTGQEAHCIGWLNDMSGGERNFCFGRSNDLSSDHDDRTVLGYSNIVSGDSANCLGFSNQMERGNVLGNANVLGPNTAGLCVLGNSNNTETWMTNSAILGTGNTVTNQLIDGLVCGRGNIISNSQASYTVGYYNDVSQSARGLCVGFSNDVNEDDEICLGHSNVVNGFYSTTLGRENTVSAGDSNYVVGYSNEITDSDRLNIYGHNNNLLTVGTDDLNVIGNGNSTTGRLTNIFGNNNVLTPASITRQEQFTVIGNSNTADNWMTSAVICGAGNSCTSQGIDTVMVGTRNSITNANSSFIVGSDNTVSNMSYNSLVFGLDNTISAPRSCAFGREITNNGDESMAFNFTLSRPITHNLDDNIGFYVPQGISIWEGDDDRNTALCAGNTQKFCFSGDVDNLTDTIGFTYDTNLIRAGGVSQAFNFRINVNIFRSDAASSVSEHIESIGMATWRQSTTTLAVQSLVNTVLINADYASSPTLTVNGNLLEFNIPTDSTNSYHFVGTCEVNVCSVGV